MAAPQVLDARQGRVRGRGSPTGLAFLYVAGAGEPASDDGMLRRPAALAGAFDRVGSGYDARPGYPEAVFELLAARWGLRPGARVVEIGPGTGQATIPLLDRGARVTAVEPGAALAAILRERLAGRAEVVEAPFETAVLGATAYDLVVAATSFHWVDPAAGGKRAADLLRDGGWLVLWWTIWGDDQRPDPFHETLHRLLRRKAPHLTTDDFGTAASVRDYRARAQAAAASGALGAPEHETVRWEGEHDPAGLRRMFATFAAWIALDDPLREELLDDVERLAREEFGGVVRRPYLTVVHAARRGRRA